MEKSTPPNSSLSDASTPTKAATLAALAHWLVQGVGAFTVASVGCGLGAWWVVFGGWPGHGALQFIAVLLGLAFLLPAAVLALFYQGLRDLIALPERIRDQLEADKKATTKAVETVLPKDRSGNRLWRFVKGIWALRTALMDSKSLLIRYGAMIRFITPWSLLAVLAATGATFVLGAFMVAGGVLRVLLG